MLRGGCRHTLVFICKYIYLYPQKGKGEKGIVSREWAISPSTLPDSTHVIRGRSLENEELLRERKLRKREKEGESGEKKKRAKDSNRISFLSCLLLCARRRGQRIRWHNAKWNVCVCVRDATATASKSPLDPATPLFILDEWRWGRCEGISFRREQTRSAAYVEASRSHISLHSLSLPLFSSSRVL